MQTSVYGFDGLTLGTCGVPGLSHFNRRYIFGPGLAYFDPGYLLAPVYA